MFFNINERDQALPFNQSPIMQIRARRAERLNEVIGLWLKQNEAFNNVSFNVVFLL